MVAMRRNSPLQPPWVNNKLFALKPLTLFTELYRISAVSRTHANKVKLRLNIGATGHDEGKEIVIRSVNSCTRAPSLSKRSWMVSMVAEAHGVVFNTSRRHVSSNT